MDRIFKRAMSSSRVSVEEVLRRAKYPADWPFFPEDFSRLDENPDSSFYSQARVGVYHIDDQAVRALTKYYAQVLPPKADVLDLCSSWVSHLPERYEAKSVTILGMSQEELDANPRATSRVVHDLNLEPKMSMFDDNAFDVVTCVVSVDYLTRPLEVFKEMNRVLRPGGLAICSFSNRCFPTKAIQIWGRTNDIEHCFIVGCYFHYAGGFERAEGVDLKPGLFGLSDPMYVVQARCQK